MIENNEEKNESKENNDDYETLEETKENVSEVVDEDKKPNTEPEEPKLPEIEDIKWENSMIIFVTTKTGLSKHNIVYLPTIIRLLKFPQSIGVLGKSGAQILENNFSRRKRFERILFYWIPGLRTVIFRSSLCSGKIIQNSEKLKEYRNHVKILEKLRINMGRISSRNTSKSKLRILTLQSALDFILKMRKITRTLQRDLGKRLLMIQTFCLDLKRQLHQLR